MTKVTHSAFFHVGDMKLNLTFVSVPSLTRSFDSVDMTQSRAWQGLVILDIYYILISVDFIQCISKFNSASSCQISLMM